MEVVQGAHYGSSTGGTVWNLKKSIAAAFYHCCEVTTLEQRHQFCPKQYHRGANTKLILSMVQTPTKIS